MLRRNVLKAGGMAILGFGFGGCATTRATRTAAPAPAKPRRPSLNLPPVKASWDRVIRTTVGLRPHRPSGFVLTAGKLDAKTVIHNYGHGAGGHSLGWGTGYLAADLAMEHGDRRAAVMGCGTVGLTAARQLQRRGFEVTIYTALVPPDTTSNMALAYVAPAAAAATANRRTPDTDAQFRRAAEISYRQFQLLVGPHYGVSWIDRYSCTNTPPPQPDPNAEQYGTGGLLPAALIPGSEVLEPGEHPFASKYAIRRPVMRIEPSIYLDALLRDFLLFGGRVVIRKFDAPSDLMSLGESLIVNCTGLGSRALFGDEELVPVKGQLTLLVPQPEVNYQTGGYGANTMPRSDGIALAGTSESGVWTLEPNEEARQRIVEASIKFYDAMRLPDAGVRLTRSEPPQKIRLSRASPGWSS